MAKRICLLLIVCLLGYLTAFSQNRDEKVSVFQLSFVPPLSTNGFHTSEYTNKISLNLLVGVSRNEEIFTLGDLTNITTNNSNGLQVAGLGNYARNGGSGTLLSGLANITGGNYTGLQLAGLANVANNIEGLQVAGLVNIAKNVKGVQFAGLINIAENSDYPIGILNLIKNGRFGIAATYNELGSSIVTFRSGSQNTYGILGIGINHKTDKASLVAEVGIGARINCTSWLALNNEINSESIGNIFSDKTIKTGYSLLPLFKLGSHFEIFGGPSINYLQSDKEKYKDIFPNHSLWKKDSGSKLKQIYVGYQIGIQYIIN
ncbi:hypothetical protein [Bacteroides reticulotermitis]|uniref:hypothetical protein n=1 Tax=Bacteroides reticulotermitis TaxID=1133319 RepID=UPI003A8AFAF3